MTYRRKVILHCPVGHKGELDSVVESFISDGVKFIGVVGKDCELIEEIIDELVVGSCWDESRFVLTSSHAGATVDDAVEFVMSLTLEYEGGQIVVL